MNKKTCDCCKEIWEENFFCPIWSGLQNIDVEGFHPVLNYDYTGSEYIYENRVETVLMSVCFNCCPGHKHICE